VKGRRIAIERLADGRSRAGLIVDGRLEDLLIDPPPGEPRPQPGAIHLAQVDRMVPGLGAAFVRLGDGAMGYLREAKGLSEGARLPVQVVSYAEAGKASPVTRRLLYKTATAILTPDAPGMNLSRQIRAPEARAALTAAAGIALNEGRATAPPETAPFWEDPGLILRSRAEGADADRLRADLAAAIAARAQAEAGLAAGRVGCVLAAPDAATLARRDWEGEVADPDPDLSGWIAELGGPAVALPGGGQMLVEPTRALVSIDVNTGAGFGSDAALRANLDAARDLPRQLRLRGLGGIVLVDFAPLAKKARGRVEDALKGSFRRDPVETSLAGWTALGLFEMQRKRERRPLTEIFGT